MKPKCHPSVHCFNKRDGSKKKALKTWEDAAAAVPIGDKTAVIYSCSQHGFHVGHSEDKNGN